MKELAVIGEFKEMLQIFQWDWILIERMPYSDQKGRREAMLEWRAVRDVYFEETQEKLFVKGTDEIFRKGQWDMCRLTSRSEKLKARMEEAKRLRRERAREGLFFYLKKTNAIEEA
jgi:hypothetical protein